MKAELSKGHYAITSHKPRIIRAFGPIPKSHRSSDLRLITNCSRPQGAGVNHYANPGKHAFESVDSVVSGLSHNVWMCRFDIKSTYHHVIFHPSQYKVTGLKYKFTVDKDYTIFYDTRLMFGASKSVGCFHRITQSIDEKQKLLLQDMLF